MIRQKHIVYTWHVLMLLSLVFFLGSFKFGIMTSTEGRSGLVTLVFLGGLVRFWVGGTLLALSPHFWAGGPGSNTRRLKWLSDRFILPMQGLLFCAMAVVSSDLRLFVCWWNLLLAADVVWLSFQTNYYLKDVLQKDGVLQSEEERKNVLLYISTMERWKINNAICLMLTLPILMFTHPNYSEFFLTLAILIGIGNTVADVWLTSEFYERPLGRLRPLLWGGSRQVIDCEVIEPTERATPRPQTPEAELEALLTFHFAKVEEMLRLVRTGPNGEAIVLELPSPASPAEIAGRTIQAWRSRGVLREALEHVAAERPAIQARIDRLKGRFTKADG